jgi:hypothetical protein
MERINSGDGFFHDGDPFNGVTGTMVTADWLNSIQEELVSVIAAAGIALDPAQSDQLLEAIQTLVAGIVTTALAAAMSTAGAKRYVEAAANLTPGFYLVNTAGGSFPLVLPLNPTLGDAITLEDAGTTWGAHPPTLARNGKNIMGLAEDLVMNAPGSIFSIWYNGAEWRLV